MATVAFNVPAYHGVKGAVYWNWREDLVGSLLRGLPLASDFLGLYSWAITPAERTIRFPQAPPHVPLPRPPAQPPAQAAAKAQWREDRVAFQKQEDAIGAMIDAVLRALDKGIRDWLVTKHVGLTLTLSSLVAALDAKFGQMTAAELTLEHGKLDTVYSMTQNFSDFADTFRAVFESHRRCNQAIPMQMQVDALIRAVQPLRQPQIDNAIAMFQTQNRLVNTQQFDALFEILDGVLKNIQSSMATTAAHGYGAHVQAVTPSPVPAAGGTPLTMQDLMTCFPQMLMTTLAQMQAPVPTTPAAPAKKLYCDTHGWNASHTGMQCKHAKENHDPHATGPQRHDNNGGKNQPKKRKFKN